MRAPRTLTRLAFALVAIGACVVGYRSEAEFTADFSLDGATTIQLDLADVPVAITGSTVVPDLEIEGTWFAVGGTAKEAERNAGRATLEYEVTDTVGRLFAVVPVEARGLIDLELDTVRLPGALDLEVRSGKGNVSIENMDGAVVVQVAVGDIDISGGRDSVFVDTGEGSILVESPATVDVFSGRGGILVTQTGASRDLFATSRVGDIDVELSSDANVALDIEAGGLIIVDTDRIATRTEGSFERTVGQGTTQIRIRARRGDVSVTMAATALDAPRNER